MASKKFNAHPKVKQVSADSEKTVRAIVTAPTLDRDGDIVNTMSLKLPLKNGGFVYARDLTGDEELDIPFQTDHEWSVEKTLGSVASAILTEAGELEVLFKLSSLKRAREAHTLLKEGHLGNAFSITFVHDPANTFDGEIYDAELIEISLVFRGSNYNARLLEVSKSLAKKGLEMSKTSSNPKLDKALAELEAKQKEVEDLQNETEQQVESEQANETSAASEESTQSEDSEEQAKTSEKSDDQAEETAEAETGEPAGESESTEQEQSTQAKTSTKSTKKGRSKMTETESKAMATESAKAKPSQDNQSVAVKTSKKDIQKLVVKQFTAFKNKDYQALRELNEKAFKLDSADVETKSFKKKAIDMSEASPLYLCEELSRDIETCRSDVGKVGSLVSKRSISGTDKWRRPVRTDGVSYAPTGLAGTKHEDEPTWTSFVLEPKPFDVIVAWNDHAAEQTPFTVYDMIVQDLAEARDKLYDNIVLAFATATTTDGTVYPDQGLSVVLDGTAQEVNYTSLSDKTIVQSFAAAWGKLASCNRDNLSLVVNGTTWGELALAQDANGQPLFKNTGQSIALGALGTFNVVTSDELPTGEIILGDFKKYELAEMDAGRLLFSQEATVGSINLFTMDHSAVRSVVRLEGGAIRNNAFVKLAPTVV